MNFSVEMNDVGPKKRMIQTKQRSFDIGFYKVQICDFSADDESQNKLDDVKVVQQYWYVTNHTIINCVPCIIANNFLYFLHEQTQGWKLSGCGKYGICINSRVKHMLQEYTMLPECICSEISSFHSFETETYEIYDVGLDTSVTICDKTLDYLIEDNLMHALLTLICIYEIDKQNGNIHVLNIDSVKYKLKEIKQDYGHHYTFMKTGLAPNSDDKEVTLSLVFHIDFEIVFHGTRKNYTITSKDLKKSTILLECAVVIIDEAIQNIRALKIGQGENLIEFGTVWNRYYGQEWRMIK